VVEGQGRLTLWGIEVFVAAAEEGSISAAARRLAASPSAISQQLSALEQVLGVGLLDRSARPLTLTAAGRIFRRHAQTILDEVSGARASIGLASLGALLSFRLGMIEDFEAEVTPRLLAAMAEELINCRFLLETGPSHRLHDQLDARALDVVVAADLGGTADWMEVHPLLSEPFVAVVPRSAGAGRDVPDLPLVLYSARHAMGRQIAAHLTRHNLQIPHRFEMDSYPAILSLVAGGAGWAVLTPLGVMHAQRFLPDVDLRPLPFAGFARTISLTARREVLGEMPARVAARLRPLLSEAIVAPAVAAWPWLAADLRLLEG